MQNSLVSSLKSVIVSGNRAFSRSELFTRIFIAGSVIGFFVYMNYQGIDPGVAGTLAAAVSILTGVMTNALFIMLSWAKDKKKEFEGRDLKPFEKGVVVAGKHLSSSITFAIAEGVFCVLFLALSINITGEPGQPLDPLSISLKKIFSIMSIGLTTDLCLLIFLMLNSVVSLIDSELPNIKPRSRL